MHIFLQNVIILKNNNFYKMEKWKMSQKGKKKFENIKIIEKM